MVEAVLYARNGMNCQVRDMRALRFFIALTEPWLANTHQLLLCLVRERTGEPLLDEVLPLLPISALNGLHACR